MRRYLILFVLLCIVVQSYGQSKFYRRNASTVVSKYNLVFHNPPTHIPTTYAVDAPLLGNGSTGVAVSGPPEKQVFYLARNDFWRLTESYNESFPCVLGKLELNMPVFKGGAYLVEQDLFTGTTYLKFSRDNHSILIKMYVSANEDLLIMELKNDGKEAIRGDLVLQLPQEETTVFKSLMKRGIDRNIQWISRQFDEGVKIPAKAACAMKIMDVSSNRFNILKNETLYVALSFSSNFKSEDCSKHVSERILGLDKKEFFDIYAGHKNWWAEYWNKSFVDIGEPEIELDYYRSLYIMGSASRDLEFPPGIFGTWVTKERPEWCGDYHLNWNHHAPFYGLFSSNRIEQALPYNYPILAMAERGREYGRNVFGIDGIMMPVGIGPLGMDIFQAGPVTKQYRQFYIDHGFIEDGGLFFYQRSNALHCAAMMSMLCYHTYNREYIELVYPFIKGVVDFWEGFLVLEGDRYVIHNDAVEEGPNGDMNPIKSLGLLRSALNTCLDMSMELNVDRDKVPKWKEMQEKLSKFPTYEKDGRTLYARTEKGDHRPGVNNRFYQVVYPGGAIHLDSDKEELQIGWNTVDDQITSRKFIRASDKYSRFPAAVRIGYNPDTLLSRLKEYIEISKGPNGYYKGYYVGIEACAAIPSCINEMMLRSRPNVIHVFPVWNKQKDALFQDLRAEGGFLVSSRLGGGNVHYIKLTSEQGRDCQIVNPWDVTSVSVIRNGVDSKVDVGERFTIPTSKDETIIIMPWNPKRR
jgi:hypothetical protein